ncbi:MAG: hypothetical protein SGILL_006155 [Bacillariaceae sp.]
MARTGSAKAKAGVTSKSKAGKAPSPTDRNWMENYEQLKEYKRENGHTYVHIPSPRQRWDYDYYDFDYQENRRFANWVAKQRAAKRDGKIRKDREKLLDEIDFSWNIEDRAWDEKIDSILKIKEKVGHVDIPSGKADYTETNEVYKGFTAWAVEQRIQYVLRSAGKRTKMTDRRFEKLEEIGFQWSRNEEDVKRFQGKARRRNLSHLLRKVFPDGRLFRAECNIERVWKSFKDNLREADAKYKETGEPTVPMFGGQFVGVENDGTYVLVPVEKIKAYNRSEICICSYGTTVDEILADDPTDDPTHD